MFIKHEFTLEMFVAVCWSYGKWYISIVRSTVPLVDHSVVKVLILALLYMAIPNFVEIFFWLIKLTCKLQFTVIKIEVNINVDYQLWLSGSAGDVMRNTVNMEM